jgi:hypothetical protein
MRYFNLKEMTRGWFVGDFQPTAFSTSAAEVAVKTYKAGQSESLHFHRIATEITLIQSGVVEMNGSRYETGAIVVVEPYESSNFLAISDVVTIVVKVPSARDDKYEDEEC